MSGSPRSHARLATAGRGLRVTVAAALALLAGMARRPAGVALAQEGPEPETPQAPGGGGDSGSWLDQMNPAEWFARQREAVFDALVRLFTDPQRGLPAMLGDAVQGLLAAAWEALWGLFEPFNFFTQIPTWIVGLPLVEEAWSTLFPLAATGLGLAAVATLGLSMLSVLGGRPPAVLFSGLRHFVRGTIGLIVGTRLYLTFIEVSNSLSARLLDPAGGLPGLERMTAAGQLVAYPVVALVYLLFAAVFFFTRAKVVFTCVACLVLAPVAFVLGALPFKKAQDAYDVWLTYAVASAFVQVVQAVFLGIGANVLTHGTSAPQVTPGVLGAGIVGVMSVFAAGTVPTMILGALLHRGLVPAGTLGTAAHLAWGLALPVLWRSAGVPPVPPRVYPPPSPPPDPGRALAGGATPRLTGAGGGPPRLIEYVPPLLPPPR